MGHVISMKTGVIGKWDMQIKTAVTGNENLFKETSRQRQQRQLHAVSGYIIFSLPSLASNCARYHVFIGQLNYFCGHYTGPYMYIFLTLEFTLL